MAYVDFDVDDYLEEASDSALIEEVVERAYDKAFIDKLKNKLSNHMIAEIPDEFDVARQYFERGDLNEAMIYLKRALSMNGLDLDYHGVSKIKLVMEN